MKDVKYDRDIETESDLKIKGKLLYGDARTLLRKFGDTERNGTEVWFTPYNTDENGSFYGSDKSAIHEFDDFNEVNKYLGSVLGSASAQPVDSFDEPLYQFESDEDFGPDTHEASIPNPSKIHLDGEIEGVVRAITREGDSGGFYHVKLNFDVTGSSGINEAEYMNDGALEIKSAGKYIDQGSENQFEEIQRVARNFEDFMSTIGEL